MEIKPIRLITSNSLLLTFIFSILSLIAWNCSGSVLQNNYSLENNPNEIYVSTINEHISNNTQKLRDKLSDFKLIKNDTIDFTSLKDSNIEEFEIINQELLQEIYSTNQLKQYLKDNNLKPRIVGYRIHKNGFGILCISKYGQGNISDYIVFDNNSEYLGHFSPSYYETQPSYLIKTKGYFINDIEFFQINISEEIEIKGDKKTRFIEYQKKHIKYMKNKGFVDKIIETKKDTLIEEF